MEVYSYNQRYFDVNNTIYNKDFEEIKQLIQNNESVNIVTLTIGTFMDNFKLITGLDIRNFVTKSEGTKSEYIIKSNEVKEPIKEKTNEETIEPKPNKKGPEKRNRKARKTSK